MKRLYTCFALLLSAAFMVGCDQLPEPEPQPEPQEPKEIRLTATVGDFTRATATAFEEGDKVGLFVQTDDPYVENSCLTWKDNLLKSAQKLTWHENEEEMALLVAYYPYDASAKNYDTQKLTLPADQRTRANYTAADQMTAESGSRPTDEVVTLRFSHRMAQVELKIDNQLGEEITSLSLEGVVLEVNRSIDLVEANPAIRYATVENATPASLQPAAGEVEGTLSTWYAILPEQEFNPELVVVTASGEELTYTFEEGITLQPGKCATAELTLEPSETPGPGPGPGPGPDPEPEPVEVLVSWSIGAWNELATVTFTDPHYTLLTLLTGKSWVLEEDPALGTMRFNLATGQVEVRNYETGTLEVGLFTLEERTLQLDGANILHNPADVVLASQWSEARVVGIGDNFLQLAVAGNSGEVLYDYVLDK